MSKFKKIVFSILLLLLLIFAVIPLWAYNYSLSLVGELPVAPNNVVNEREAFDKWQAEEKCTMDQCSSITPYWMYRWLFGAIVNDFITKIDHEAIYKNVSTMASKVAIHHMRQGNFNGKGMGWWHLTHISLSIWVQRNWSVREIVTKFSEISA